MKTHSALLLAAFAALTALPVSAATPQKKLERLRHQEEARIGAPTRMPS